MFCFITCESSSRYKNFSFYRLALAAKTTEHWKTLLIHPSTSFSSVKEELSDSTLKAVVLTSELMNVHNKLFKMVCNLVKENPHLGRIMFMSDLTPQKLKLAEELKPHKILSLAGYLLPSYSENPEVFIPHPGLNLTFPSHNPLQKLFVPEYHFSNLPKKAYLKCFYAHRIEMSRLVKDQKNVVFQKRELSGQSFYKKSQQFAAALTTIPSESYPFLPCKLWEILSSGVLLIAGLGSKKDTFESLGFKHGIHYLSATPKNIKWIVGWVTDPKNSEKIDQMRKAGYELIQRSHLEIHRLEQISEVAETLYIK